MASWLSSTVLIDLKHKKKRYRKWKPGQTSKYKYERTTLDDETKS